MVHGFISLIKSKWEESIERAIYSVQDVFGELHQEFKNQPTRAFDSNGTLWAWPRVQANVSAISTESTSRSKYKTSFYEESSIKLMKNASILSSKKNQVFSLLG